LAFVGDRKQEDFCQSSCFLKDSHCIFFGNKKTRSIVILRYTGDICSDKLSKPQPDLREETISFFFRRDDGRLKIFSKKNIGIEDVRGDVLQLLRIRKSIKILWKCF
jgi:hypothetical protein